MKNNKSEKTGFCLSKKIFRFDKLAPLGNIHFYDNAEGIDVVNVKEFIKRDTKLIKDLEVFIKNILKKEINKFKIHNEIHTAFRNYKIIKNNLAGEKLI